VATEVCRRRGQGKRLAKKKIIQRNEWPKRANTSTAIPKKVKGRGNLEVFIRRIMCASMKKVREGESSKVLIGIEAINERREDH